MNKGQTNLQDNFLNHLRKENTPVTIYLVTGAQLKGFIRGFDPFTVILDSPGKPPQLVYKHALASVVPGRPINNFRMDVSPASNREIAETDAVVEDVMEQPAEEPS